MSSRRNTTPQVFVCAFGVLLTSLLATFADAEIIGDAITIRAEGNGRTGQFTASLESGSFDASGNYSWSLDQPIVIMSDDGLEVASIQQASINIIADPIINLNFVVSSLGTPTMFTIASPILSFLSIANAEARASAEIGVTDIGGNGALLSGNFGGGSKSYTANYDGAAPGGTTFAQLVDNASTGVAFGSLSSTDVSPSSGGFTPVGTISNMSTLFQFSIGSFDSASGTSVFVTQAVPEPGASALFGMTFVFAAGLFLRRRRVQAI